MLLRVRHEMARQRHGVHRRGHARAQTTTTTRCFRQNGRVMRVQLEENVSLAARMMPMLEVVAERGPVTRATGHA